MNICIPGVDSIFEFSVVPGANVKMECSRLTKDTNAWWFDGEIIYHSEYTKPVEIGLINVQGNETNSSTVLYIEGFSKHNEGNYQCGPFQGEKNVYKMALSRECF